MPGRKLTRGTNAATLNGRPAAASSRDEPARPARFLGRRRDDNTGRAQQQHLQQRPQPEMPLQQAQPAPAPQQDLQSELALGLQPQHQQESQSEQEPELELEPEPESSSERRHTSPERLARLPSPEPASRQARRAKRQRLLHGEGSPVAADASDRQSVRSARRCLFGSVDHAELERSLHEHQRAARRADSHRWNFDFERELPLPGAWQWERVGPRGEPPPP